MASFVFAAVNGDGDLDTLLSDPLKSLVDPATDRVDITGSDPAKLNAYAAKVHAVFPTLKVSGHVSSLADVQALVDGGPVDIYGIDYDFEKDMTPEFTKDPAGVLDAFQKFTAAVHTVPGLVAIGYITGTELGDRFDYGPIAAAVDRLTVQTQEAASVGLGDYQKRIDELLKQLSASSVSYGLLGAQFSFGDEQHAVDPGLAVTEYSYSLALGVNEYELWDLSAVGDIVSFLEGVGR
jgi:hypothetical protein